MRKGTPGVTRGRKAVRPKKKRDRQAVSVFFDLVLEETEALQIPLESMRKSGAAEPSRTIDLGKMCRDLIF